MLGDPECCKIAWVFSDLSDDPVTIVCILRFAFHFYGEKIKSLPVFLFFFKESYNNFFFFFANGCSLSLSYRILHEMILVWNVH